VVECGTREFFKRLAFGFRNEQRRKNSDEPDVSSYEGVLHETSKDLHDMIYESVLTAFVA
jgi:hypothetical protein